MLRMHDQVISEVSSAYEYKDDWPGYVFVPPFCNLHAHLGESVFRNIDGNDWSLKKYLNYTNERNEEISKEEQQLIWEQSADATIDEMSRHGIALFCAGRSAEPAKRHGKLTMAGYPIMNNEKIIEYKEKGIQGFDHYISEYQNDRISIGVFLHSLYANDLSSLKLAKECMDNGSEFITIHISEDKESRQNELKLYGESPLRVLNQSGLLTEKTILIHCGYADTEDIEMIADAGATIVICPVSNHFLNTKMPDVQLLEKKHIRWCVATDGWATGRTLSLIEQAQCLHKQFPDVSSEKLFDHITYIPGSLFHRGLYTGKIEKNVENKFLRVSYGGDSAEELIDMIMSGYSEVHLVSLEGGHM